jgi:hypothetical protein
MGKQDHRHGHEPKPAELQQKQDHDLSKQCKICAVSTTTSPVTQEALVAVNSASINGRDAPPLLAIGSMRSNAPVMMIATNPSGSTLIGLIP